MKHIRYYILAAIAALPVLAGCHALDYNEATVIDEQWVYDNSWREDNPDAILPRLTFVNLGHNKEDSRVWLIDSSFLRLKNIEIGYTIRKISFLPGLSSVRLYVSGSNVLTFSKFKANDPESHGGAYGDFIKYPMTRVINFGVKLNM